MPGICWLKTTVEDNTTRFNSSILMRTSVLQDRYELRKRIKLHSRYNSAGIMPDGRHSQRKLSYNFSRPVTLSGEKIQSPTRSNLSIAVNLVGSKSSGPYF